MESYWRRIENPRQQYTPGKACGNEVGERFWRRSYNLIHHRADLIAEPRDGGKISLETQNGPWTQQ